MARLPPPVTMITCSSPLAIASSTPYWMVGLSTSGSISFGWAFVTGRNRVPSPAAGKIALRTVPVVIGDNLVDPDLHSRSTHVDAVAPHRDAFTHQQAALQPSFGEAAVGTDDAMPRNVGVRGRQDTSDEARRAGFDVAIGSDEPWRDGSHLTEDACSARVGSVDVLSLLGEVMRQLSQTGVDGH